MKSLYVLTLMTFFVAGCANRPIAESPVTDSKRGVASTSSTSTAATDTTPAADESGLPKVELTGDLLNDLLLADIAARRGHLGVSVKLYEEMAQYSRDPRLAEQATRVAIYANLAESALASAQLWLVLEPSNAEAKQIVTALMVRSGQPDLALAQMEKVLASEGGGSNGFMAVAGLLSREKDKKLALDLMQRFVAKHKESADATLALSHLAMRLGELELAGKSADEALLLRPNWTPAALQHARILVEQGKTPQALSYLKSLVDAHPEVADYRLFYARLLADGERLPEAYEQFQVLDKLQPGNEDTMFALGFVALQLNHLDEAERYLTRIKEKGTRNDEASFYLGRLEEQRNNDAAATKWYAAITEGDHYINAQIRLVVITARTDLDAARARLSTLKTQRPTQKLRLDLVEGEVLTEHEQYAEALQVYTKALEEVPDNADLLYVRAMVAEKLGDTVMMESDLKLILARNPNHVESLNALGYTLADRTDRLQEAGELIGRALELRPGDYFILDSMGWLQYRLGHLDEAVKYLRRALESKMDIEIAAHLGEVLWVKGDKQGAQEVWQKALDVGPATKKKIITKVMERLQR